MSPVTTTPAATGLAEGRIALLFDGFDELALRLTYDRALEHFETVSLQSGLDSLRKELKSLRKGLMSLQKEPRSIRKEPRSLQKEPRSLPNEPAPHPGKFRSTPAKK